MKNVVAGIFYIVFDGWAVDRFGAKRISFWSGIVAVPAMGWYLIDITLWNDDRLFTLWYAFKSIPYYLFYLANLVLAMRVTAQEVAAISFAVFMAVSTIGFTIAAAILPSLEDFGGYQAIFGTSASLILVAGLLTLFLKAHPAKLSVDRT